MPPLLVLTPTSESSALGASEVDFSALAFQDCSPYFHHWMPRFASYRNYVAQSFPMLAPDTHAVRVTGNFKAALEAYHSPASPVRFRGLRQAQAWPIFPFRVCL